MPQIAPVLKPDDASGAVMAEGVLSVRSGAVEALGVCVVDVGLRIVVVVVRMPAVIVLVVVLVVVGEGSTVGSVIVVGEGSGGTVVVTSGSGFTSAFDGEGIGSCLLTITA
jgi:hypothetical protein